jgi:hypothetical protein
MRCASGSLASTDARKMRKHLLFGDIVTLVAPPPP